MAAQIILGILIFLGFGLNLGTIDENGGYNKKYLAGASTIATIILGFLLWWGDFFENNLNVYGILYVSWHLVIWGIHIAKHGQSRYIRNAIVWAFISLGAELFLIYKSGFFDPIFS